MKTIFRYVYSMVIAFLSLGIFSSCSNMAEEDNLSAMNNSPIGDFGEIQPLTLVTPDNQVLENAFGHPAVFYGDDYKEKCMQIFCLTSSRDLPVPEYTFFGLFLKVPNLNKLKAGQSLDIYQSELSWSFSSSLGDFQNHIPNGASVIVREANDEYIDLYVDHLKFTFSQGFHLKNGDYTVFGDIRFLRSEIQPDANED